MRSVRPVLAMLLAACSLPLLAACGPDAGGTASAEASVSSAAAALSSSASAAVSSASAAMSSASAAMSSSASAALDSASQHAATTPSPTTGGSTGVSFRMPDMRGQVLQDAQNALHADGVFYSRSHDLLGSRHQVLDRDWKVCSQNVPAGQQITGNAEGAIDFGVVKLSETCP
jgi:hypothetical protein